MISRLILTSAQRAPCPEKTIPKHLQGAYSWGLSRNLSMALAVVPGCSDVAFARCVQMTHACSLIDREGSVVISVDDDIEISEGDIGSLVSELAHADESVGAVTAVYCNKEDSKKSNVSLVLDEEREIVLCGLGAIAFKGEALLALRAMLPRTTPYDQPETVTFTGSGALRHTSGVDYVGEDQRLIARLAVIGFETRICWEASPVHGGACFDRAACLNGFERTGYLAAIEREMNILRRENAS